MYHSDGFVSSYAIYSFCSKFYHTNWCLRVIGEHAARAQCLVLSIEIFDKAVCMYVCTYVHMYMDDFLRKSMRVYQFY
jgi:hypothetical protein